MLGQPPLFVIQSAVEDLIDMVNQYDIMFDIFYTPTFYEEAFHIKVQALVIY